MWSFGSLLLFFSFQQIPLIVKFQAEESFEGELQRDPLSICEVHWHARHMDKTCSGWEEPKLLVKQSFPILDAQKVSWVGRLSRRYQYTGSTQTDWIRISGIVPGHQLFLKLLRWYWYAARIQKKMLIFSTNWVLRLLTFPKKMTSPLHLPGAIQLWLLPLNPTFLSVFVLGQLFNLIMIIYSTHQT